MSEKIEKFEDSEMDKFPLVTKSHTLFKSTHTQVQAKADDPTFTRSITYDQYDLHIGAFDGDELGMQKICHVLSGAAGNITNDSMLRVQIASGGGYVTEGLKLYNVLNNIFADCTTVLDPFGYSMGALTFVMGETRVIYKDSEIMFHDYGSGNFGKAGELISHLEHESKHVRSFFRRVIMEERGKFLTEKEFEQMLLGKDFWFGPEEMLRRGIATHIIIDGVEVSAKKYLKKNKKKKKK